MRGVVAPGAREKHRDDDGRDQPGEDEAFDHARHAAHREIDGQRRDREQAADQARRNEDAMTRGFQGIASRRRMHQRIDVVADLREQTHLVFGTPLTADALPCPMSRICPRPLKRKLRWGRRRGHSRPVPGAGRGEFERHV